MLRDASNEPFDDAPLKEFTLDALSRDTVDRYRMAVTSVRPNHPWLNLENEDFLVKLNAIKRVDGEGPWRPTRAGLLMFGFENEILQEYAHYFLDYREMDEGSRWADRITSQDGTWTGNVFDFWSEVLPRLTAVLKRPFALGANLQRIEDTDMHAALREAFVNALVHADYYGRRGIVVLRHADRIEVSNPGSSRVALDVVRAGGVSDARNPTLMRMFGLISACERAGSGFDVMKNAAAMADALPPVITESYNPDRVEATLHLGRLSALSPNERIHPSRSPIPDEGPALSSFDQADRTTKEDGEIVNPSETMEDMIERCAPYMVESGSFATLDEAVSLLGAVLPHLKRWRSEAIGE